MTETIKSNKMHYRYSGPMTSCGLPGLDVEHTTDTQLVTCGNCQRESGFKAGVSVLERYKVSICFVIGDSEKRYHFTTRVTISEDAPYTDVSDEAHERLYAKYPNRDITILDEDIDMASGQPAGQ